MSKLNRLSTVINQANVFYNYTVGFDCKNIDLLKTSAKLIKYGITKCVFFSDFKFVYLDDNNETQVDWIIRDGRQWDSIWKINFNKNIPELIASQLFNATTLAYHENKLGLVESKHSRPYLRAQLPTFIMEDENGLYLPIFVSVKIYNNGIATLSFQNDTSDDIDEDYFIDNVVNIYQNYFKSIWVSSEIQRLDAEEVLLDAYDNQFSIAGTPIENWKTKRLIKKMRKQSKEYLERCLNVDGQTFDLGEETLILHEIAGTKDENLSELSMDLCKSQYINAISSVLVSVNKIDDNSGKSFIWVGRPSISLLRFSNQPSSKEMLNENFHSFLSKILGRISAKYITFQLPPDLRPFNDYALHGNRALLLWTWLRASQSPQNWWDHENAYTNLLENQARAEHIEFHNMRTERAASWALSPPSPQHLSQSFKDLAFTDEALHHSSQAGEISDALTHLLNDFGTTKLISASKDSARWHLDEMKYRAELKRSKFDRIITFIFGLVGTAGLADFAVEPLIKENISDINSVILPLLALGISALIVFSITAFLYLFNKPKIQI